MPPITTMRINSVGNSLNGVTVGCTGMGNFVMMTARTTISIINESYQGWLSTLQFLLAMIYSTLYDG